MIINGNSRSNGVWFSKHLTRTDENERVTVCGFNNLVAENVHDAFREMKAASMGTRCDNYFFHVNMNPEAHEHLTPEQWEKAINQLEKNLGLEGQARFVVEHEKHGRTHRHIIWSRIDVENQRAISDSLTAKICHETARGLEREFGLNRTQGVYEQDHDGARAWRRMQSYENFRGQQSGIDPAKMKEQVTDIYRRSDNGQAFAKGLEEEGYRLLKGDRRDFCIMDKAGHVHSLARRIEGVKVAELREFMKDVDREMLPSIAQARKEFAISQPRGRTAAMMFDAFSQTKNAAEFSEALKDKGLYLANVTREDAQASIERREAAQDAQLKRLPPVLKEGELVAVNQYGDIYRLNKYMTGVSSKDIQERMKSVDRKILPGVEQAHAKARLTPWERAPEGHAIDRSVQNFNQRQAAQKQGNAVKAAESAPKEMAKDTREAPAVRRGNDIADRAGATAGKAVTGFFDSVFRKLMGESPPPAEPAVEREQRAEEQKRQSSTSGRLEKYIEDMEAQEREPWRESERGRKRPREG